ncbi:MAG TPA: hypothetical protein VF017_06970 [Thermoanaerobaculia bacterium]|nr:hypothetical protein [Thermoanaerobaculia bacterium]
MRYETPRLQGPIELYQTPMLVDIDEAAAEALDIDIDGCNTSGSGNCGSAA